MISTRGSGHHAFRPRYWFGGAGIGRDARPTRKSASSHVVSDRHAVALARAAAAVRLAGPPLRRSPSPLPCRRLPRIPCHAPALPPFAPRPSALCRRSLAPRPLPLRLPPSFALCLALAAVRPSRPPSRAKTAEPPPRRYWRFGRAAGQANSRAPRHRAPGRPASVRAGPGAQPDLGEHRFQVAARRLFRWPTVPRSRAHPRGDRMRATPPGRPIRRGPRQDRSARRSGPRC